MLCLSAPSLLATVCQYCSGRWLNVATQTSCLNHQLVPQPFQETWIVSVLGSGELLMPRLNLTCVFVCCVPTELTFYHLNVFVSSIIH